MRKILAFGTFDLLHKGHISYLKQAKKFGDELYVLVACDQAVKWAKGFAPEENEKKRLKKVKDLKFVDFAWIGEPVMSVEDYLKPINKTKPDVICLGYDQAMEYGKWLAERIKTLEPRPKLVRLKPYKKHIYKTSLIKKARR